MGAAERKEANRKMAANMKARTVNGRYFPGVTRTKMGCPMCGKPISIEGQIAHLNQCGRKTEDSK